MPNNNKLIKIVILNKKLQDGLNYVLVWDELQICKLYTEIKQNNLLFSI